ncbi:C40 family peptidase [Ectobacillus ponti]|uniref:C40 family peptidase n=1 Tax=Ectobacillus ponti TaxID=2961894 RepID=A0AA41X8T3_9BACI|nr:C40 family peptidase [Ectobacillus ponti]MCP8969228.1 C40 family peptidase [Ectobacillus ponti]
MKRTALAASLLSITLLFSTAPASAAAAPISHKYVSVDNSLHLRKSPSTTSPVLAKLGDHTKVRVLAAQGDWTKIEANGKTGYVHSRYLTKQRPAAPAKAEHIISFAKKYIGTPYVFGGTTPRGFDCSGYIFYVLSKNGYDMKRTNVAGYWSQAKRTKNPKPGDLIFFQNTYKRGPSHMGIYLGNGSFIHASSSKDKVRIDNMNNSYYKKHFLGYGRLS